MQTGPVGIFDSGYGGLTIFRSIRERLPQYDYVYLGDNGRAPYGNRSFATIYQYTLECVEWFFERGCPLVIIACNTASAKALRTIQQQVLPVKYPDRRVLGVIRPTTEMAGRLSATSAIGVLGTRGTVNSQSYLLELQKFYPQVRVFQQACPMWVPLIENGEIDTPAMDYFCERYVRELLDQSPDIDTVLLACTHYPLIKDRIAARLPAGVRLLAQGPVVAPSLEDYLLRHPEIEGRIGRGGGISFFTTDDPCDFEQHASQFFGQPIRAEGVVM